MNYYYLVASLPSLQLSAEPPMTMAALRALCEEQLTQSDLRELDALLSGDGVALTRSRFGARCAARMQSIRVACAIARAERRSRDASVLPSDEGASDSGLQSEVRDAFAAANPMERERRLDAIRWRFLEREAEQEPFAAAAVFSYALRLRILLSWVARTAEAGNAALDGQKQRMLVGFDNLEFTMDAATETGA